MDLFAFIELKKQFTEAELDEKIRVFAETEDLTDTQYRELLLLFPINELERLEKALV